MNEPQQSLRSDADQASTPPSEITPLQPAGPLLPAVSLPDSDANRVMRRRTRRSFLTAAVAAGAGYGGWRWLNSRRLDDGIPWPLRRVLEFNEGLARDHLQSTQQTPEMAQGSASANPRLNGDLGLGDNFDPARWRLHVAGLSSGGGTAALTLSDIKALPRVDVAMRLCCIEGWSIMVNWTGARFSDFVQAFPPMTQSGRPADVRNAPHDLFDYVAMATPDASYYVGLDIASVIHSQTLLCYEIDGKPLTLAHGAPLRLVIPTKYGVKNIKRLGSIRYTGVRPADYWAQQGYDWFAGL